MLKDTLQFLMMITISLGVAVLLRLFAVDFYSIPSDSMSPAIEPGDFIMVNKLSFGARMYRNFDFLENGSEPETWRVKGFSPIRHGDVVVFNFPYARSWDKISMHLSKFYVKRCIGIPGDTLRIREGFYEINGKRGFGNLRDQEMIGNFKGIFPPGIFHTIPFDFRMGWNIRNMGPLYIPRQGDVVRLDSVSIRLYQKMMEYENRTKGKVQTVNTNSYTFRTNWYFMAGDRMWNSQDSRYIGLIPEEFIVGKATRILYSKDRETGEFYWDRFLKRIR